MRETYLGPRQSLGFAKGGVLLGRIGLNSNITAAIIVFNA